MSSLLRRVAALATRRPRLATVLVLLAVPVVLAGAIAAGGGFEDDFTVPGIESQKAQDLLEARFPAQSGTQATVVFTSRDGTLQPRDVRGALDAIGRQPHVVSVEGLQISEDGRTGFAVVGYDEPADALDAKPRERLEDATAGLPAAGVDVAMAGEVVDGAATGGFPIGEAIGLALAVVLL
ncbi:MAG TPA: MMPL family transporter, partial [Solirubrobacteraceae bacterium]|nr:MMPL family transporter [Solirubrobacteraceae bacterium]